MNQSEIDALLSATLADDRLTGSEAKALKAAIAGAEANLLGLFRSRAFALARSAERPAAFDWLEAVVKLFTPESTRQQSLAESHFSPGDACWQSIAAQFRRARRQVDVCVFTITDDRIAAAILDAHARGVQLRILTDDEKSFDEGSDIPRLAAARIEVRQDRSPFHMHHKFAIFDEATLLTGSYNWTRGAAAGNQENLVLTDDLRLIRSFAGTFESLWNKFGG